MARDTIEFSIIEFLPISSPNLTAILSRIDSRQKKQKIEKMSETAFKKLQKWQIICIERLW